MQQTNADGKTFVAVLTLECSKLRKGENLKAEDLSKLKERNEEEHERKSEGLRQLESQLRIKEAEQSAELKYLEKAKAEFHLEKSSFDNSKRALLASVDCLLFFVACPQLPRITYS